MSKYLLHRLGHHRARSVLRGPRGYVEKSNLMGFDELEVSHGFMIFLLGLIDPIFVYKIPIDIIAKACTFVEVKITIVYFSFFGKETTMP